MDDATQVRDTQGPRDIQPDPRGLQRRQPAAAPKPGGEVLALHERHHEVGLVAVGAGVEAGDDVRVAQNGGRERLATEPVGQVAIGRDLGAQDLDRDLAVDPDVGRAMDRGHPAAPDHRPEPIATTEQRIGGSAAGSLR